MMDGIVALTQVTPSLIAIAASVYASFQLSVNYANVLNQYSSLSTTARHTLDDVEPFLGYHEPPNEDNSSSKKRSNDPKHHKPEKPKEEEHEFGTSHPCWSFFSEELGPSHDDSDPFHHVGRFGEFNASFSGDFVFPYDYCQASYPSWSSDAAYTVPVGCPLYCLVLSAMTNVDYTKNPRAKLTRLHVFHRHGDRTPNRFLPFEDVSWFDCTNPEEQIKLVHEPFAMRTDNGGVSKPKANVFRRIVDLSGIPYDVPSSVKSPDYRRRTWEGNCHLGQLTSKGHSQMRTLGGALRDVYLDPYDALSAASTSKTSDSNRGVKWIYRDGNGSQVIEPDEIHVRSTDVWRTMQSVQSLLIGMYPYGHAQGKEAKWRIHVRPKVIDPLSVSMGDDGGGGSWCPRLTQLRKTRMKRFADLINLKAQQRSRGEGKNTSELFKNGNGCDALFAKTAEKMHVELDALIGATKGGGKDLERWFDTLRCRACHNKPRPCGPDGWVSEEAQNLVFKFAGWFLRQEFGRWDSVREEEFQLRVGPLLKEIVSRMVLVLGLPEESKTSHENIGNDENENTPRPDEDAQSVAKEEGEAHMRSKKVFIYSSHDTTISALLRALRIPDGRWPAYSSNIIIEEWWIPPSANNDDGTTRTPTNPPNPNEYFVRVLYNGRPQKIGHSLDAYILPESDFIPWLLNLSREAWQAKYPYVVDGNREGKTYEELCKWVD
jgi:hypothetical protein